MSVKGEFDNISVKELAMLAEEYMNKRKQIEKKYKIEQLNKDKPDNGVYDRRYYVYIDGKKIKKKDKDALIDWLLEYESNGCPTITAGTFCGLYDSWRKWRLTTRSDGTCRADQRFWENFIRNSKIASKQISMLDIDDGIEFFHHCQKVKPDLKEKYFNTIMGTVNSFMRYAKKKRLIDDNPFDNLEINSDLFVPKTRHEDEEQIFSDREKDAVKKLAVQLAKDKLEAKYLTIILLLDLGIRDGELMALKWSDFDLKNNRVHIQSEFIEKTEGTKIVGYKYVDHTKTPAGDRFLPLNSEVLNTLKLIKILNFQKGYNLGDDAFLFYRTYHGTVSELTPRTVYNVCEVLCRNTKINCIKSPHDCRRTFATNLHYADVPTKEIQFLMGHEDISTTESYIKRKEDTKEILRALEKIV